MGEDFKASGFRVLLCVSFHGVPGAQSRVQRLESANTEMAELGTMVISQDDPARIHE